MAVLKLLPSCRDKPDEPTVSSEYHQVRRALEMDKQSVCWKSAVVGPSGRGRGQVEEGGT